MRQQSFTFSGSKTKNRNSASNIWSATRQGTPTETFIADTAWVCFSDGYFQAENPSRDLAFDILVTTVQWSKLVQLKYETFAVQWSFFHFHRWPLLNFETIENGKLTSFIHFTSILSSLKFMIIIFYKSLCGWMQNLLYTRFISYWTALPNCSAFQTVWHGRFKRILTDWCLQNIAMLFKIVKGSIENRGQVCRD